MSKEKTSFIKTIRNLMTPDSMFHDTEKQANRLGSLILLCSGIFLTLITILTAFGVFPLTLNSIFSAAIQAIVEILILLIICIIVKNDAWWLKYLLVIGIVIVYARLDSMLTHKAAILMVVPVVFSSRYFSRRLTVITSIFVTVAFALSAFWGATHGLINLNIVTMEAGTPMTAPGGFLGDAVINAGVTDEMLVRNTLLYDYFPKWMMFFIVSIISCNIAKRGREMVVSQHEKDVKTARIESELNLATNIQASMLPSTFPAFPDRSEFDIYASMEPAKEVGGDFYDFFFVDSDHLCMVIADVSGKGIPAALFMMASKIIFKNNAMAGKSPAEILTDANRLICSNNREEMFITVWLGILEISTSKLTAANAGHEYPIIKRAGGAYELFKDRHGLVVGGMAGTNYREYEIMLDPGSKLFVYTDGVAEATDANGAMFGTDRIIETLNKDPDASPDRTISIISDAVSGFVKDAEQFDDITMLCLDYRGNEQAVTKPAQNN